MKKLRKVWVLALLAAGFALAFGCSNGSSGSGSGNGGGAGGSGGGQTSGGGSNGGGNTDNSGNNNGTENNEESKKEYLSLENLNSGDDKTATYDSGTKTITFIGEWANRGWWFGEKDASDYTKVTVAFTDTDNMGYLNLVVQYEDDGTDSNSDKKFDANGKDFTLTVELNAEKKSSIKQVYITGGQTTGQTATIKEAYFE